MVALVQCAAAIAFDFDDVSRNAAALAAKPYKPPPSALPKALQELTYDQYRDIRFLPSKAVWRNARLPFELQFFHPGLYFNQPVRISEIVGGTPREIRFDPALFDYGKNAIDRERMKDLGYAGFRVHYALNNPKYKDEVLVFLGASYFRALGKEQRYGVSARGLAIDTALPSGEEFPRFVEYWIEQPAPTAKELVIYALLDSPRVAGAYRFTLRPGSETVTTVKSRLFLRDRVAKLALAPLTSMYLHGENQSPNPRDYRPEVHDSDILLIRSNTGEWITRPLVNPKRLLVTSFGLTDPVGFGLMQRDRAFESYQDLEARYEQRPSAWVEPQGAWGKGRVELVQIPTPDETNDNIVAFWVPEQVPPPNTALDFEYRLRWQRDTETRPPLGYVAQSRRGHGYMKEHDASIGFLVDFDGEVFRKRPAEDPVEAVITADANGELVESRVHRNEVTGGWRLRLRVKRVDDKKPIEIRAFLHSGGDVLTTTWSYVVPPE